MPRSVSDERSPRRRYARCAGQARAVAHHPAVRHQDRVDRDQRPADHVGPAPDARRPLEADQPERVDDGPGPPVDAGRDRTLAAAVERLVAGRRARARERDGGALHGRRVDQRSAPRTERAHDPGAPDVEARAALDVDERGAARADLLERGRSPAAVHRRRRQRLARPRAARVDVDAQRRDAADHPVRPPPQARQHLARAAFVDEVDAARAAHGAGPSAQQPPFRRREGRLQRRLDRVVRSRVLGPGQGRIGVRAGDQDAGPRVARREQQRARDERRRAKGGRDAPATGASVSIGGHRFPAPAMIGTRRWSSSLESGAGPGAGQHPYRRERSTTVRAMRGCGR